MKVYDNTPYVARRPCAVALGNFDGVHLGHAAILRAMQNEAAQKELEPLLWTFRSHPGNELAQKPSVPLLTALPLRLSLLEQTGVETVVLRSFTDDLRSLSPEEFVNQILCEELHAAVAVCGFNYHFGENGRGDSALLKELCAQKGIFVVIVPPVTRNGEVISSTAIRTELADGHIEQASQLLGHPFYVRAKVVSGQKLARRLGFPTINQQPEPDCLLPRYGVYITRAVVDGICYKGVTNVGLRPTVDGQSVTVETNLIGFEGDLYGREIELAFYHFLRPEQKFASVDALAAQVQKDTAATLSYFKQENYLTV